MSLARPERMLFVLSQGRSGTAFLADLLNRAPRTLIRHEWPGDPALLGLSRYGRSAGVVAALLEQRFAAAIPDDPDLRVYGEVNSYLRYNADWLRERFDPALLHVVRDGREVVRSIYERDVLTPAHAQLPIVPVDGDPLAEEWPAMSRFERICWIWRHTNEMLGRSVNHHARLEDLLSSFAAFRGALLEPTGIEIDEATWQATVGRPRNTSAKFRARKLASRWLGRSEGPGERLPHWRDWPEELTDGFWRVCGEQMERFGYAREG